MNERDSIHKTENHILLTHSSEMNYNSLRLNSIRLRFTLHLKWLLMWVVIVRGIFLAKRNIAYSHGAESQTHWYRYRFYAMHNLLKCHVSFNNKWSNFVFQAVNFHQNEWTNIFFFFVRQIVWCTSFEIFAMKDAHCTNSQIFHHHLKTNTYAPNNFFMLIRKQSSSLTEANNDALTSSMLMLLTEISFQFCVSYRIL